eukprot:10373799-Lingulodinium_polyedra.AAC.1
MVRYMEALSLGHLGPAIKNNGLDGVFPPVHAGGICKQLALDLCSGRKSWHTCQSEMPAVGGTVRSS